MRLSENDMEELLPCPFCESDAYLVSESTPAVCFCVECSSIDCFCVMGESYDRHGHPDHVFKTEEAAVLAWNKRTRELPKLPRDTKKDKPELNLEGMQLFYDFGGMLCYEVIYFNPALCKVETSIRTFNDSVANDELARLRANGFTAGINRLMVSFNGAFSKTSA